MFDIALLSNFRLTVKFESVHCEVLKGYYYPCSVTLSAEVR
jgi:hypothetical protein